MNNQKVDFSQETCQKIDIAIHDILNGICSRVDITPCVKVYECKNIIRIDLKVMEDK